MAGRFACIALLLFATSAAGQSNEPREATEIKATLTAMWDAIEKGELDRYASYLHTSFTSFGETDVYLAEGKDAEVQNYREYLIRAKNIHTDMHQPSVTVRGDIAWITYYWTDSGTVEGKHVSSRGKSTRIFVREGGKWLCIHAHHTAVP
jgi:ketosteroid isomerase-like protein